MLWGGEMIIRYPFIYVQGTCPRDVSQGRVPGACPRTCPRYGGYPSGDVKEAVDLEICVCVSVCLCVSVSLCLSVSLSLCFCVSVPVLYRGS